ncbi:1-phosphofructokinase [Actinoplanes lobatus]|uniref:1-phosphofructokinase n=1 Tax=Actinoplanes lobatus TaxID=113568 RepID=A0A7W7MJL0_9ACTN|nr:PfkB family carbohydrate kinase [Actinoplanes lobatus]MBB4752461.1 1-phosphofructokinase [Actinoplanes lobatus]GGN99995.1 1-phosphofructokinase [Actinoplanes lobatus]GIE46295.1 1-phosphofructokinase [Actinoplanes lobatus]
MVDDEKILVFAPVPQLTVTVEEPGEMPELHVHPGGQGIWQARMCAALGASVTLCAAVGGEIGRVIAGLLEQENLRVRAVTRDTGSGWYVHDRRDGGRTEVAEYPGAPLGRHDLDELYTAALAEGLRARLAVLSGAAAPGVVRPDVYRRLATDLNNHGVQVVADLTGDHLNAVLQGGVAFLKISHEELIDSGRAAGYDDDALLDAARQLRADGAAAVLISRAERPSIALLDDKAYLVRLPPLQTVDHRGAGDSMTAGVATVLARGGDLREAVRTGAAAGALNVTRHGLGTGHRDAIAELTTRVELTRLTA